MAFLPLPETKGALPVTRYKVKVEHDGARAAGAGFDQALTSAPDLDDPSTGDVAAGGGIEAAGDASGVDGGRADSSCFANPTLAHVVLVPARGVSARPTSANVANGEQGRPRRIFVTMRGLKPSRRYRVQVYQLLACTWVSRSRTRGERGGALKVCNTAGGNASFEGDGGGTNCIRVD